MMTTRENWKKYEKTYFMPPTPCYDWVNYNHVILEKPVRGRYARFCSSAEGYAEVAECIFIKERKRLSLQTVGEMLQPQQILLPIRSMIMNRCRISFHQTRCKCNGGFGKVVTIDNFMYMPRNDDNFVRIGDYYELFYWGEGCWNSLGEENGRKTFSTI